MKDARDAAVALFCEILLAGFLVGFITGYLAK